jgi:hypothetical protein
MFWKRCAVLYLVATSAVAVSAVGYLRVVGPSPLRFETSAEYTATLPPLSLSEPLDPEPSAGSTNAPPDKPTAAPPVTSTPQPLRVISSSPPVTAPTPLPLPTEAARPESAPNPFSPGPDNSSLTPQMLIQFFQQAGRTNHVGTSIVTPLNFTPPPTAAAPSSTATYIGP